MNHKQRFVCILFVFSQNRRIFVVNLFTSLRVETDQSWILTHKLIQYAEKTSAFSFRPLTSNQFNFLYTFLMLNFFSIEDEGKPTYFWKKDIHGLAKQFKII